MVFLSDGRGEAEVEAGEEPIYKAAPSRRGGAIHRNTQSTGLGKVTGRRIFIKENEGNPSRLIS